MDGTLAITFLLLGLTDMAVNDCPTGCLTESRAQEAWNIQAGELIFQSEAIGSEIYVGYDTDRSYGPFQITYGASVTDGGDAWVGFGTKWTSKDVVNSPFFIEGSLIPGLYARGNGPDIDGALQFRSALGVGYGFDNGGSLTVLYDHRSNADTQLPNPGIETFGLRYTIALN